MDRIKKAFKDDPIATLAVAAGAVTAAAMLINAVAHIVGSTGYAIHAAKR